MEKALKNTHLDDKSDGVPITENIKIGFIRDAVGAALTVELSSIEDKQLLCLDAPASQGLCGLQWKQKNGCSVHCILADQYDAQSIRHSAEASGMHISDWLLDSCHVTGQLPIRLQEKSELHLCSFSLQTVLHEEPFGFVFLHPKQNLSQYTDALFTTIRHNALICIQHHDMASQCIRSPHLIERQFQAYVLKTEYCREMAMRILIGDLARCASRHQRGIKVMFVVDIKDHMLAVVRVTKNNQSALSGLRECRHVIHCLICEERSALPYVHTPIESPYSMLPCDCNSTNPGKTAVLLGPMWMGELVDIPYTRKIIKTLEDDLTSHQKPLNSGLLELLRTSVIEGICPGPEGLSKMEKTELICGNPTEDGDSELKNGTVPCDQSAETVAIGLVSPSNNRFSIHGQSCETVSNNTRNSDIQTGVDCKIPDYDVLNPDAGTSNSCDIGGNGVQRKRDEEHAENDSLNEAGSSEKKSKLEGGGNVTDTADKDLIEYKPMPLFYYGIHNKRLPKFPKLNRFVECMQRSGYRASRTHFDSTAIRTDANLRQLTEVIQKYNQTN